VLGADQAVPSKIAELPEPAIAIQNDAEVHDTEIGPRIPVIRFADHLVPLNARTVPSRFTAAQNDGVAQDTSMTRSFAAPVVDV
jgi:hypothetical protein